MELDKGRLESILDRTRTLPTLPDVARRVLEIINDPDSTVKQLSDVVALDPALSGKILKLVNSAFYGFPRSIETLTQAFVVLGLNTVRSLALGVSMIDYFKGIQGGGAFDHLNFWRHSVGVALFARRIAQDRLPDVAEETFVAGILHDAGQLVLGHYFPKEMDVVLRLVAEDRALIEEVELDVMGVDHARVGAALFERWKFPVPMVAAIGGHHEPDKNSPHFQRTAILHAADQGVKAIGLYGACEGEPVNFNKTNDNISPVLVLTPEFVENCKPTILEGVRYGEQLLGIA